MNISCFTDCGSEDLVMRVPYNIAVQMVHTLPDSDAKKQLIDKMSIASRRSSKFAKMLRDAELRVDEHV